MDNTDNIIIKQVNVCKKNKPKTYRALTNKQGFIDRDVTFELQFGFKDTTDTIMYESSKSRLDVIPLPKFNVDMKPDMF